MPARKATDGTGVGKGIGEKFEQECRNSSLPGVSEGTISLSSLLLCSSPSFCQVRE